MVGAICRGVERRTLEVVPSVRAELADEVVKRLVATRAEPEKPQPSEDRGGLASVLDDLDVELESTEVPGEIVGSHEQHPLLPAVAADDARAVLVHHPRHHVGELALRA